MKSSWWARSRVLDAYFRDLASHPVLTREQELALVARYKAGEAAAGQELILANLRYVVKIAYTYRGYGMGIHDLVQEGSIGLMRALKKYDPAYGFKFFTYATYWIRAKIHAFIMSNWSLVKYGTTPAQRKLFFRIRSEREKANRALGPNQVASIEELAQQTGFKAAEVAEAEARLSGRDLSLNKPLSDYHKVHGAFEYQDLVEDPQAVQADEALETAQEKRSLLAAVAKARLKPREMDIIKRHTLATDPLTLAELGKEYGVSRERVRQLREQAIDRIKQVI